MCGIVGIVSSSPVNLNLYDALTVLQHRGQDAAGIMTCNDSKIFLRKSKGLVNDVFRTKHMEKLQGNMGIGHVRYPTAGSSSSEESQPFFVNYPYGIGFAHNGNLTNTKTLKKSLSQKGLRHINTESDSEILLNILAYQLQKIKSQKLTANNIFKSVTELFKTCKGGFSCVALIPNIGLIGFRDNYGIRPLTIGRRKNSKGYDYMMASESVAMDMLGYELINDVAPGEAVFISANGELNRKICFKGELTPCLFEYVYLARPDSVIDNVYVHRSRLRMGDSLAKKIKKTWQNVDIDVVIPVPDTSRTSALQLAKNLNVSYHEGFIKNRYIGRTFIMPGQKQREKSVRQKLNPLPIEFKNKNVLLVDDSIVRGTTSAQIVDMVRKSGAKKVYFASAAPEVKYPNVYGIDMPSCDELIAHNRSVDEIAKFIDADKVIFQDLEDLKKSVQDGNKNIKNFEASIFDGNYVTGDICDSYLKNLENERFESKQKSFSILDEESNLGVYNNA